jgi:hypothetical protein
VLSPGLSDLLRGVADALEADILGMLETPAGAAQLVAAIEIVRRVATALPKITAASVQDSLDVADTLLQLSRSRSDLGVDGDEAERLVVELSSARWAIKSLDDLERLNDHLRGALARAAAASFEREGDDGAARELIRAALRRMTERDLALGMAGTSSVR